MTLQERLRESARQLAALMDAELRLQDQEREVKEGLLRAEKMVDQEQRERNKQSEREASVARCQLVNKAAIVDAEIIYESLASKGGRHARLVLGILNSFKYPLD